MRGGLMRLWTVEEHTAILKAHDTNKGAATVQHALPCVFPDPASKRGVLAGGVHRELWKPGQDRPGAEAAPEHCPQRR